jgi:hypothetical protein
VRTRTIGFDEEEQVARTSTTVTRTRLLRVARQAVSLCVTTTVEVAGHAFSPAPQEITKPLAPDVESSQVLGTETVEINGQSYSAEVIQLITRSGTKRDVSELRYCSATTPQTLKRVTTTTDTQSPNASTTTTVTVTELNKQRDILGEMKCTWSVTTVIETAQRTITIEEVHCQDVPGELVTQVTEERDAEGKLVRRNEMELVGYGLGRARRIFRRR